MYICTYIYTCICIEEYRGILDACMHAQRKQARTHQCCCHGYFYI